MLYAVGERLGKFTHEVQQIPIAQLIGWAYWFKEKSKT